jgi:hypothetical protein
VTDREPGREESELLSKASDLRVDLLSAVAKLEQYADALKIEVARLKKLAEERRAAP